MGRRERTEREELMAAVRESLRSPVKPSRRTLQALEEISQMKSIADMYRSPNAWRLGER